MEPYIIILGIILLMTNVCMGLKILEDKVNIDILIEVVEELEHEKRQVIDKSKELLDEGMDKAYNLGTKKGFIKGIKKTDKYKITRKV